MGAPGGTFYMGQAFNMLASGMKEAFSTFQKFGPHKGLPTSKDIPLLVKALKLQDSEVAGEAHRALVWLTGVDLGRDPQSWNAWWSEHGPELARAERDRRAAKDLFDQFRSDILTGRWEACAELLSLSVLKEKGLKGRACFLRHNAALLRQVYRDAKVSALEVVEDSARLSIDWGAAGFEFVELTLVREEDNWKFRSAPWGNRVTRRVARARKVAAVRPDSIRPTGHSVARAGSANASKWVARAKQRHQMDAAKLLVAILAVIGGAWGFWWLATQYEMVANLGWVLLGVAIFGSVPISLLYCIFFGRLKRSREIRHELKMRRGVFTPGARGRR